MGDQKRGQSSPGLELEMVLSCPVDAKNQTQDWCTSSQDYLPLSQLFSLWEVPFSAVMVNVLWRGTFKIMMQTHFSAASNHLRMSESTHLCHSCLLTYGLYIEDTQGSSQAVCCPWLLCLIYIMRWGVFLEPRAHLVQLVQLASLHLKCWDCKPTTCLTITSYLFLSILPVSSHWYLSAQCSF